MTRLAIRLGIVAVLVIVSLSQPAVAAISDGQHPAIGMEHASDGLSNLNQAAGGYHTVRAAISSGGAVGLQSAGSRYQAHAAAGQSLAAAGDGIATLGFWWRVASAQPVNPPTLVYLPLILR